MATYVSLLNWTEKGVAEVGDTVDRAQRFRQMLEQMGGKLQNIYWTQGRYDVVAVFEAPDDETVAAALLRTAGQGSVRSQTLRAFSESEMRQILQKMG